MLENENSRNYLTCMFCHIYSSVRFSRLVVFFLKTKYFFRMIGDNKKGKRTCAGQHAYSCILIRSVRRPKTMWYSRHFVVDDLTGAWVLTKVPSFFDFRILIRKGCCFTTKACGSYIEKIPNLRGGSNAGERHPSAVLNLPFLFFYLFHPKSTRKNTYAK